MFLHPFFHLLQLQTVSNIRQLQQSRVKHGRNIKLECVDVLLPLSRLRSISQILGFKVLSPFPFFIQISMTCSWATFVLPTEPLQISLAGYDIFWLAIAGCRHKCKSKIRDLKQLIAIMEHLIFCFCHICVYHDEREVFKIIFSSLYCISEKIQQKVVVCSDLYMS